MTVMYQTIDLNLPIPDLNHRHFERGHRSLSSMKSLVVTRVYDRKSRNSARFLQSLMCSLSVLSVSTMHHPIKYQISSMKTLFLKIQSSLSMFLLYYKYIALNHVRDREAVNISTKFLNSSEKVRIFHRIK